MRNGRRGDEGGSYLVMGAIVLMAIFITVAVGVDLSRKWRLEQTCQDTADAAALAGAAYLPDTEAARTAAINYIQQYAPDYVPPTEDIMAAADPTGVSGRIGVIVQGNWDALFMPLWLTGDDIAHVQRYAIAEMVRDTEVFTSTTGDTFGGKPGGQYAIFLGDTTGNSQFNMNNSATAGGVHGNHPLDFNGNNADFMLIASFGPDGLPGTADDVLVSQSAPLSMINDGTDWSHGNQDPTTNVDLAADEVEKPAIDESQITMDIGLDIDDAGIASIWNAPGTTSQLVAPGDDGLYGTADDIPIVFDDGSPVMATYNGLDAWGHQDWTIDAANNLRGIDNPGLGDGIDLKVGNSATPGDLLLTGSGGGGQKGWNGAIWTTGSMEVSINNMDFLQTADNPGLTTYIGEDGDPAHASFTYSGNHSLFRGLIWVDGSVNLTGNPPNWHGAITNGAFIRGSLVADNFDPAEGGGVNGNNWFVYYDADLVDDVPTVPDTVNAPPILSTPDVWLVE